MAEWLFSYGTLQNANVQLILFERVLNGSPDILKGYKTIPLEIKDESFLSKGESKNQLTLKFTGDEMDSIPGTVFELTSEELIQADKYEPAEYKRTNVELESGKQAWVYMAG